MNTSLAERRMRGKFVPTNSGEPWVLNRATPSPESPLASDQAPRFFLYPKDIFRFNSYIFKTESCWVWTGTMDVRGYGVISICRKGKTIRLYAHRIAFLIKNGDYPLNGKKVCHKCNNPSCVNPSHLYEGTDVDNRRDSFVDKSFNFYLNSPA